MNDDYDKHIVQKYRLALAIAIIKDTPENSTPKAYLEELRNNIIPEMESYDPDMTVCEDDFNDDDDHNNDNANYKPNDFNANNDTQIVDSQMNDSITILKDFEFNDMMQIVNNETVMMGSNSVSDVLRILKGVGNEDILGKEVFCGNEDNQINQTQSTYCESSQTLFQVSSVPITDNITETQKIADEINNKTNEESSINPEKAVLYESPTINTYQQNTDNFTHVSQSQDNIVVPKYFIQKDRSKDKKSKLSDNMVDKNSNVDVGISFEDNIRENNTKTKNIYVSTDYITIDEIITSNDTKKHKLATKDNNNIENTQAKRFKNIDDKFKSNIETFNEIKNKSITQTNFSNSEITLVNNLNTESNEHVTNLFKSDNFSEGVEIDFNNFRNYSENNKRKTLDNFGSQTSNESNYKTNKIAYKSQCFSQFNQEFNSQPTDNAAIEVVDPDKEKPAEQVTEEDETEEQIIEELFDELTDSQTEAVPFKVLEELNKIKSFLNKRNRRNSSEYVSDSGYKSDSQSRSSFKRALQCSNIWLNQSAHCLLEYISRCPLVVNTEDIINEISKTLGHLIDRLHEEEKYPSFLEEHLQIVDSLLKEIYEEESADKLLKKDENIYRLLLLNKSSHIIKYTTEKIISILEDLHTTLTNEELLEISRTIQTENLSYIFHILEILLKKLLVYKNLSQQGTQNSQEEEIVLKRSSIADIWRKKWNPDKKCVLGSSGGVKECVLVRCGEVLNKLIVQAMDGYSLISYFALQCFNLLQN